MRKLLVTALMGTVFTMCGSHGKVPDGCCKHGDRLDVVVSGENWVDQCNQMGGEPIEYPESQIKVCENVDF